MITQMPLSLIYDVSESFDSLDAFIQQVEAAIETIIADQQLRADTELWSPDLADGELGAESQRALLFEDTLPRTARYSTVLLAHAAIESLLSKLCSHVQRVLALRFSRSDMGNRTALPRYLEYLQKALGDDLSPDAFSGPFREKLGYLSTVRNCIAHTSGEFKMSSKSQATKDAARCLGFSCAQPHLVLPPRAVEILLKEARAWAEGAYDATDKALTAIRARK